jgi:hypothetical protein
MGENVTLEARLVHRQLWNCGTSAKQAPDQINYNMFYIFGVRSLNTTIFVEF